MAAAAGAAFTGMLSHGTYSGAIQVFLFHLQSIPHHLVNVGSLFKILLQEDVFSQVQEVVCQDTEAFARRAGMKLLLSWHRGDVMPSKSNDIRKVMIQGIHDLDWEVKLTVLDYWEAFVKDALQMEAVPESAAGVVPSSSSCQSEALRTICQCGCSQVLLDATVDCDRAVQAKGLGILKQIHSCSSNSALTPGGKSDISTVEGFMCRLSAMDFDTLLREAKSSTDQYVSNPEALLDDILASMAPVERQHHETDEEADALAVDCYWTCCYVLVHTVPLGRIVSVPNKFESFMRDLWAAGEVLASCSCASCSLASCLQTVNIWV